MGRPGGGDNILIIKRGGESPIVAIREALTRKHGGIISPEQPPEGEHAANGAVDAAGKTIRDMAKVLKMHLESRLGRTLHTKEPVMHWLVRWAAMALSRFQVGKDHRTAHQRQTGKACNVDIVPFAEEICYRIAPTTRPKTSMESRWEEGRWLGHTSNSNELLVGNKDGIAKAWAIRRRPLEDRCDDAMVLSPQGNA